MSFNWIDFLSLAERLQSCPKDSDLQEACFRSAASRAYYAAYQYAFQFAKKDGYIPQHSGDDHKDVQRYFSSHKSGDPTLKKIGKELDRLRDKRNDSDYEEKLPCSCESLAQLSIGMAKGIIDNVDNAMKK